MERRIGEDIGGGNFAANQRRARNRPQIACVCACDLCEGGGHCRGPSCVPRSIKVDSAGGKR